MIRADEVDPDLAAPQNRSWSTLAMAMLVVVAFVIAGRRERPLDPAAPPSGLRTHADSSLSLDAVAAPPDTAQFLAADATAPSRSEPSHPDPSAQPPPTGPATTAAVTTPSTRVSPTSEPVGVADGPSSTREPAPAIDASGTTVPVEVTASDATATTVPPVDPILVSRPIPDAPQLLPPAPAPPWAASTRTRANGLVSTDVGCAAGTSAGALDSFFRDRVGPVVGLDYQHVYPLGGSRYLWLFQDTFVDHSGSGVRLDQASFVHNTAIVQDGTCFTLLHRGSPVMPESFEPGTGERRLAKWFWPMGGEMSGGQLFVFWAEMEKDGYEPRPGDGLGWHPKRTWLAVYDPKTFDRLSFQPAPNSGVYPIYGYAVASDADHTYLFGNTFEQNLAREGGFRKGPHSGTAMYLARIPRGQFGSRPEYRTVDGWSADPGAAHEISSRFWAENPMQPRLLGGRWVAATKVDGYWGERLAIDVANAPWGPWTTVSLHDLPPRNGDPLMNTYHAHLMPWLDGRHLVVSVSQNARNMRRDAWPSPHRYRPAFSNELLVAPPPDASPETTTPITIVDDTTPTTVVDETTTPRTIDPATTAPDTTATTAPTTIAPTTTAVPTTAPAETTATAPPTPTTTTPATTTTTSPPPSIAPPPPSTAPAPPTPPPTTADPCATATTSTTTTTDPAATTTTSATDPCPLGG